MNRVLSYLYSHIYSPKFTRPKDTFLFDWLRQNGEGKRILNLGSGIGLFDRELAIELKMINMDIDPLKPNLDLIADAHQLPFKRDCFDIVYSIAVLEHTKKPWLVADEIDRILCKGGIVILELPFLNVIHDFHDYFRFTDKGIVNLFDEKRFSLIHSQVTAGGGSFLGMFLLMYFMQFIPGKIFKAIFYAIMRYPLCLLKYLDILIDRSKNLRVTANSFGVILRKI